MFLREGGRFRIVCRAVATGLCLLTASLSAPAREDGGFVPDDLPGTLGAGDRAALLMVHFGTTYEDTRALTIDAINRKAQEAFPELTVREAYTSRIVIRKLKERGTEKLTPLEMLLRLRGEGYTHVVVQSTNIIDGAEMESLRRDVESVKPFFKEVRTGTPLLYNVEDAEKVTDVLAGRLSDSADDRKEHFVWVGHGTYTPDTAVYSQIDYMLKAGGRSNFHVGTIEGYPTFDTVLAQLKRARARRVTLVPFMFVAGDHARNDIAGEWREALEKEGFTVTVRQEGLGEIPEIQELFLEHVRFSLKHRPADIMEKKRGYAADR